MVDMQKMIDYMKRNAMFVLILAVIIIVTAAVAFYQVLVASPSSQDQETAQSNQIQSVEPTETETAIVGFTGKLTNNDVVVLTWQIDQGQRSVTSSTLYYVDAQKGDVWLADVTNHSSYQLSQDAYQFAGGANTFKIVCTLDDDEQIESTATVNIVSIDEIEFHKEDAENGVYLILQYSSAAGTVIDVPVLSFYGNEAESFSIHYLSAQKKEEQGKLTTTVSYLLQDNDVKEGNYRFTIKFQFLQLNQDYEYTVEYEKAKEDADASQEEKDEQSVEETIG